MTQKDCLHIGFVSHGLDFTAETPYVAPLGGSQSCMCYLGEALAAAGHDVRFFTSTSSPGYFRGVMCHRLHGVSLEHVRDLDLVIFLNLLNVDVVSQFRHACKPDSKLVAYIQHDIDQPAVQPLHQPEVRNLFDGFALVSDWMAHQYVTTFNLPVSRIFIARSAISPPFQGLFAPGEDILPRKAKPPILFYSSTPFRGLDILLQAFPLIRQAAPDIVLRVFSSMKVYQARDTQYFESLYELCRTMPGVEYVGSLPQAQLAQEIKNASILTYPNTFPEAYCITIVEAMAAGCLVVTSDLGALPETGAGYALLGPTLADPRQHAELFASRVVQVLHDLTTRHHAIEQFLQAQVTHINRTNIWAARASQWQNWFPHLFGLPANPAIPPDQRIFQSRKDAE